MTLSTDTIMDHETIDRILCVPIPPSPLPFSSSCVPARKPVRFVDIFRLFRAGSTDSPGYRCTGPTTTRLSSECCSSRRYVLVSSCLLVPLPRNPRVAHPERLRFRSVFTAAALQPGGRVARVQVPAVYLARGQALNVRHLRPCLQVALTSVVTDSEICCFINFTALCSKRSTTSRLDGLTCCS